MHANELEKLAKEKKEGMKSAEKKEEREREKDVDRAFNLMKQTHETHSIDNVNN